ncbi:MAG: helix-turn-helix domain-containing protein [Pseudomonadota bacterium]
MSVSRPIAADNRQLDPAVQPMHPCGACPVRSLSICAALDHHELDHLAEIVIAKNHAPHQTIFAEGDEATDLFNVTGGTVMLYKLLADGRRQITGFLFGGDFMGLSVGGVYAYSAEAITPVSICRFPRKRMERMLDDFPKMQRRLFSMASNELASAQDQMLLLGRKTAKEKLASFLLNLSRRAVRRGQPDNPITVPMGRADIGDYLGLTTETVSRTVTQLKTASIIRLLDGHKIQIVDREALEDIAEGL